MNIWVQYSVRPAGQVVLGGISKQVAYTTPRGIKSAMKFGAQGPRIIYEDANTLIFYYNWDGKSLTVFQKMNVDLPRSAVAKVAKAAKSKKMPLEK